MVRVMRLVLDVVLFVLLIPVWPLFWLMCRLDAKPCPKCKSKWETELIGEWDGEMWECHACGYYWETPYYVPLYELKDYGD